MGSRKTYQEEIDYVRISKVTFTIECGAVILRPGLLRGFRDQREGLVWRVRDREPWDTSVAPSFLAAAGLEQRSVSVSSSEADASEESIVGLWNATFYSDGKIFDQGIDEWHSDGNEILNDTAAPQPPNGAGTVCLGVFKKTGPRSLKLRHPFWSFDANGNLAATGVILEDLTVALGGATDSGSFSYRFTTFPVT